MPFIPWKDRPESIKTVYMNGDLSEMKKNDNFKDGWYAFKYQGGGISTTGPMIETDMKIRNKVDIRKVYGENLKRRTCYVGYFTSGKGRLTVDPHFTLETSLPIYVLSN